MRQAGGYSMTAFLPNIVVAAPASLPQYVFGGTIEP